VHRATQTAVIVTVPSAEHAVAPHRARFDPAADWGVPAHVTVLYPFVAPSEIDDRVIKALEAAVASVPRFEATCHTTGWFGTDVLWLDPQPADPFRALTTAVVKAFPGHPPYGGEYADVVPHVTVAHRTDAQRLREVERDVLPHLPIHFAVTAAELWRGTFAAASWERVAVLRLR
jgi:2'-5' RNA ligase